MHTKDLVHIFEHLIAVNLKAFNGGEYRVAFYALAAALDAAKSTGFVALVLRVSRLAIEQQADIDATMPFHDMATTVLSREGKRGYTSLVAQARAIEGEISRCH